MHPNPVFHTAERARNIAHARDRAFGVLAVAAQDAAPFLGHLPFLLSEDGTLAELHLMRSNPISRALSKGPRPARLAISGPDSYVSPDWYGIENQVPTWNYVAIHLTGHLELLPQDDLRALLDRQSAFYEDRLAPKPAWTTAKMDEQALEKMMRMIVPARMTIDGIDGTWKLGQNKPDTVRNAAADHVDGYGFGSEARILAALMRGA